MSMHTSAPSHVADLLPAFVNNTLSRPERTQVMAHLTLCPACTAELHAWQAIQQATVTFADPISRLPDVVLDRLWAVIDTDTIPRTSVQATPLLRPSQEDVMTTLTLPSASPVASPSGLNWLRRTAAQIPRRQTWLPLLVIAAFMLLTISGALLPRSQPRPLPNLSGILPWQSTLPPDVPTYRGDWQHTGTAPDAGPLRKPDIRWKMKSAGEMRTQPVLVDGVVYASSRDGNVYALDYATGSERWRTDIGGNPEAALTVTEGLVFAGDNNPYLSYGNLSILDAADGNEVWRLKDAQTSGPVVIDGVLYTGTGDGLLHAYDAASGEEQWQAKSALMSRGFSYADGVLYYGGQDNAVYAVSVKDGSQLWRYQAEDGQLGTITISDGMVYEIAFDGRADQLYALDAVTGEERWRFAISARLQPLTVRDGTVYLPGGDGSIYALDARAGTVRWRFNYGDPTMFGPVLAGDTLYVTGGSPTLYAVDAATGIERWHVDVAGGIGTSPAISGGLIFVTTSTGNLFALGERGSVAPTVLPAAANVPDSTVATFLWRAQNGTEPIREPHGMAIAPDGNIWLAEGSKNRFLIFSPDGKLIEAWGKSGPGEGEFNFMWSDGGGSYGGLTFDQEGNIFVADPGNHRVQKFDRNRQFVTAWGGEGSGDGQLLAPVHVATDAAGNVYVSDGGGIQKFSNDGEFMARIGRWGNGDGEYSCTAVLSVDKAGNVYVPDCEANRVLKFSPDGVLLLTFGSGGRDPGELNFPSGTAVDAAGNIFVADAKNSRVDVFDANGTYLTTWGGFGDGDGQFLETTSLVLDDNGNAYVSDYRSGTLQKFLLQPPLGPAESTPTP